MTEESPERLGSEPNAPGCVLSDLAPSRAPYRCPLVRAPSLDHDRRQWGTGPRSDWRPRVGAGGSGRERVAQRETRFRIGAQTAENRAPCRVIAPRVRESRYRESPPSLPAPRFLLHRRRNTQGPARTRLENALANPRSRHVTVRGRVLSENVTYSESAEGSGARDGGKGEGEVQEGRRRGRDQVTRVHRAFGPLRHPSGDEPPS